MLKGWGGWEKGYKLKKKGRGVKMVFCLIGVNRKFFFNNRIVFVNMIKYDFEFGICDFDLFFMILFIRLNG